MRDRERFAKQATQLLLDLGATEEEAKAYPLTLKTIDLLPANEPSHSKSRIYVEGEMVFEWKTGVQ
jgi:hypothetical protein